ncbi:porin [Aurantimonas sp. 22II-16-19i]|uniref:porin n=1 Tax=Aurantimonas sp. 22II-16-19i TaxID=1317114 RepID=UPI0009F7F244|nr:porin [Aurantimonas sp. 22II-16-19i]ORE92274.1 porin [Aurantimonas sp. 22II-16-19i]
MNIKSLLLGSAAALVAVSGARAADVIVPVAPEPAEYVKVCDVYGTGFYYIPGTETCLKIGGYVRYKIIAAGNLEDDFGVNYLINTEDDDYRVRSRVRVRLNFDAREETELGTLRAFARVQAENNGSFSDASYGMDMGYIQLGGLTMGYLDTLWTEGDGLLTDTDLPVGDFQVNRISYTYAADGFSAALSIEDDNTGDFAPDVVGRLAYEGGWGSIYLAASYDEETNSDDIFGVDGTVYGAPAPFFAVVPGLNVDNSGDAFALKAGLSLKDLIATDSELKIEGSYAFDPSSYSTIGLFTANTTANSLVLDTVPVEWQIGAGYAQSFGKLGFAASGVYGETFEYNAAALGGNPEIGDGNYYKLVGNVGYEITKNFDMLAEVSYAKFDFNGNDVIADTDTSFDQVAGFLQFVRSF